MLYIEPVVSALGNLRLWLSRQPTRPWRSRLSRRGERLWSLAPAPWLPLTRDSRLANRLGHWLAAPAGRRALRQLDLARPVVVAGWPPAVELVGSLNARALVYDCMDDLAGFEQLAHRRRLLLQWEQELANRADLITTTSEQLQARWRATRPRVELLRNAVPAAFIDAMAGAATPADFAAIRPPRLLFVGTLAHWIDVEALARLAADRPDWSLVLVGPVETEAASLTSQANVHRLGVRPHASLPGYLAAAEALLIPFRLSAFTHAVNPVKLYEYLAAGPPIVASPLREILPYAARLVLTSPDEPLSRAVQRALDEGDDPRRRAVRRQAALANTWEARAETFQRLLATLPPRRPV